MNTEGCQHTDFYMCPNCEPDLCKWITIEEHRAFKERIAKLEEWQEEATRLLKLMLTRSSWKGEKDFIERLLNEGKESK